MKTTSRKDKSKDNMGTPKTSNNHRPRETQEQSKKKKKTNKNKKGIKINGTAGKPEQESIVSASSSQPQGGDEKSKKGGSSKRQHASNGNPSRSSMKQRRKTEEDVEEEEAEEEEEESKLIVIPLQRVQRIVKSEGPDLRINQEAYFLINKATEKFIGQFCEDAFTSADARERKRFLKYSHLSSIVARERRYDFLSDFVPEKVKAEDALKEIKKEET